MASNENKEPETLLNIPKKMNWKLELPPSLPSVGARVCFSSKYWGAIDLVGNFDIFVLLKLVNSIYLCPQSTVKISICSLTEDEASLSSCPEHLFLYWKDGSVEMNFSKSKWRELTSMAFFDEQLSIPIWIKTPRDASIFCESCDILEMVSIATLKAAKKSIVDKKSLLKTKTKKKNLKKDIHTIKSIMMKKKSKNKMCSFADLLSDNEDLSDDDDDDEDDVVQFNGKTAQSLTPTQKNNMMKLLYSNQKNKKKKSSNSNDNSVASKLEWFKQRMEKLERENRRLQSAIRDKNRETEREKERDDRYDNHYHGNDNEMDNHNHIHHKGKIHTLDDFSSADDNMNSNNKQEK